MQTPIADSVVALSKTIQIDLVLTKEDQKAFTDFPYTHYVGSPNWTPPLRMEEKKLIDTKKNPYYKLADLALFIARRDNIVIGRIAAIVDRNYNDYNKTAVGFFGFFECIDHDYTAQLLFKIAGDWLKEKGMNKVIGPTNPSFFDPIGTLIEGFEHPNRILMPYNWAYYDRLIKSAGLEKSIDLLAFGINRNVIKNERYARGVEIVKKRQPNIKIRKMDFKQIDKEVKIIHEIYNKAWASNWGYAPLPLELLQHSASDLKMIADPDLAIVAEDNGRPVAFSITLPDIHEVFRKIGNGRLFPTGIFTLIMNKSKVKGLRTALAGVLPEYRSIGVDVLMHHEVIANAYNKSYDSAEWSWVLENNVAMIRLAERAGAFIEKRYRMYEKALS
jgi:hypothetical protein